MNERLYTQDGITPNFNYLHPSPTAPILIGLSGYAQSGKDSVAQVVHTLYGHAQRSFAAPLKEALYRLNPLVSVDGVQHGWSTVQTLVNAHGWDIAKQISPGADDGLRGLLQRFGTEVGREMFGEDFWVERAFATVAASDPIVFSDVRFPNEARAVVERGGVLLRVHRPGVHAINGHPSDSALDHWDFSGHLVNDGSLVDLEGEVQRVLGEFGA